MFCASSEKFKIGDIIASGGFACTYISWCQIISISESKYTAIIDIPCNGKLYRDMVDLREMFLVRRPDDNNVGVCGKNAIKIRS